MVGKLAFAAAIVLLCFGSAQAQQWADKMFAEHSHDFGPVPRAAKIEHRFVFKNVFKEDVHIAGVRSSCGCTSPRVDRDTLKTYEEGAIVAEFNTRTFLGQHGAHLTVTIDKPMFAEVSLDVKGYIRTDVVVDPSEVNFGSVEQGTRAARKLTIDYAGDDSNWKILEAKPGAPYVAYTITETKREPGRVSYELNVQLAETAPVGYLHDQLVLVTNDHRSPLMPVVVEGRVAPELSVSPSPVALGLVQPGQSVTKQLVIRAKRPFVVTKLEADGGSFSFKIPSGPQQTHVIPLTFTAGAQPGKVSQKIHVETDLNGQEADVLAIGEVAAPLAGK
jgi:hypothetical protein